jgi:hypothetical protein
MKHLFELSYIMLIEYLKKMDIRQGPSRLLIFTIMASWIDIQFSQKKKRIHIQDLLRHRKFCLVHANDALYNVFPYI